jgi:spore germination protein
MVKFHLILVILVISGLVIFFLLLDRGNWNNSDYDDQLKLGDLKVFSWIPHWDQAEAIESFKENADVFHSIGLFWYYLTADGDLALYSRASQDDALISLARENNVQVMVSVANLNNDKGRGWDSDLVNSLLGTAESQSAHVQDIVSMVVKGDYDGVIIDYEGLDVVLREQFTSFIQELSVELRKNNKLLGVTILPITEDGETGAVAGAEAQDLGAIAAVADYVYVMSYGHHGKYTDPGPVAALTWVEEVLKFSQARVPADKLFIGVPIFGYDWEEGVEGHGLTHKALSNIIDRYEPDISYNKKMASSTFEFIKDEKNHVVWFEDERSLLAKLRLFKEYNISNFAFWRLGNDDQRVWEVIRLHGE